MTQVCCPSCRLRFTRAAAAYLASCPECGEPPQPISSAEMVLGYRLASFGEQDDELEHVVEVAMPGPIPFTELS
jgi:hypothetical protein